MGFYLPFFDPWVRLHGFNTTIWQYTCQNNELSFLSKHFEVEWIMLSKEMVPALATISVFIACLESIRAINML